MKLLSLLSVIYCFPSRILTSTVTIQVLKLECSEVVNLEQVQVVHATIKRNSWVIIFFGFPLFPKTQYNPQLKNQLSSIHAKSLSPAFQQVTEHGENYKVMCNRYNLETRYSWLPGTEGD